MSDDLIDRIRLGGPVPRHVAIIMDGNGRWATERGLPRHRGHREGMKAVRAVTEAAGEIGIEILTLFAFSDENWNRPAGEISALMRLLREYIDRETDELIERGVQVNVLGDRTRLSGSARAAVERLTEATASCSQLVLNLCISYGARAEIVRAVRLIAADVADRRLVPEEIDERTIADRLYTAPWPDPDLLIRTSGEMRISNFLLWQIAYTELFVTSTLWPDFGREGLFEAVVEYQRRERRFGKVTAP